MSGFQNWNLPWLQHNSQRRYPLAADATAKDTSGDFTLPDSFLVGLYLPIAAAVSVDPTGYFIQSLRIHSSGFSLVVGHQSPEGVRIVARAVFPRSSHVPYATYRLTGEGDFYDSLGTVTIGRLDDIELQPPGQWNFAVTGSRLEVDAIRPEIRGVSSVRIRNGNELSDPLGPDIVLMAGNNFRLQTRVAVSGENIVLCSAVGGVRLNRECSCPGAEGTVLTDKPPVRTVNYQRPGPDGNIQVLGTSCVSFEAIQGGIRIKDTCAEPCCGCEELAVVTEAQQRLESENRTFAQRMTALESSILMLGDMLGLKIGDRGCLCDEGS